MSSEHWRALAVADRRSMLMSRMMEATGVPGSPGPTRDLLAAERRCRACAHGRECRRWLTGNPAAERAPALCPNARLFERLRRG